uniref:DNA helicase B n=1 Tax=Callorhinchus milii TaxID=7868 RepID=V9K8Y7_CALMI
MAAEEEEEEEHVEELQFLDFTDMVQLTRGGCQVKAASLTRQRVTIEEVESGKRYDVFGHFHLTDPWWTVTARITCLKGKWHLEYYPSYSLRTRVKDERTILSLFFTKCGVHHQHQLWFWDSLPKTINLEFANLMEILQSRADVSKNKGEKDMVISIIAAINNSLAGQYMQNTLKFPHLMERLPSLLPRQFLHIMRSIPEKEVNNAEMNNEKQNESINNSMLEQLEQIIQTDVWKLGFNYLLRKEVKLVGCEATLEAFERSNLFRTIPELQQHALVIYDELKRVCWSKGHTFVDIKDLTGLRADKFSDESAWVSLEFLKSEKIIVREKTRVYLRRFYKYEKDIAMCIEKLVNKPPWIISLPVKEVLRRGLIPPKKERSSEQQDDNDDTTNPDADCASQSADDDLDSDQVKAATMMCENPVTVVSGKGGCGKTTVVSLIFKAAVNLQREVEEACKAFEMDQLTESDDTPADNIPIKPLEIRNRSILFTAPTGKAASLLKKKTQFDAYTLHQVMWSFYNAEKCKITGKPIDWMFSQVNVLIIDEGSLVSVQVLSSVLRMLMEYALLQKLIILGDVRQLPSIEPGNMLADMYNFHGIKWGIELLTNHRAESQLIIDNATKISEMGVSYKELEYDAVMCVGNGVTATIPTVDKRFIKVSLPRVYDRFALQDAIQILLKEGPGLKDHQNSQFIAFRRRDCDLINELCCKHYSKHSTKNHKNRIEFQNGDKVCCTKNGYVRDLLEQKKSEKKSEDEKEKKTRLCNGEVFFIGQDLTSIEGSKKTRSLYLDDLDERKVQVNYNEIMRECKLQHAWARTIHTFQGSEADTVVYIVGVAGRQNWQHIYTAVTRGRQRVYVITSEDQFIRAVKTRCPRRSTRLRELLQENLSKAKFTSANGESLSQQPPSQTVNQQQSSSTPARAPATFTIAHPNPIDSSPPTASGQAKGDFFAPHSDGEINEPRSETEPQRETSYSADLEFAQNYSWSSSSQELEDQDMAEDRKSPTAESIPSPQTSSGRDAFLAKSGDMSSQCCRSAPAASSPDSKRLNLTVDEMETPTKQSKVSLVDSPLGSMRLGLLKLEDVIPKQLFSK